MDTCPVCACVTANLDAHLAHHRRIVGMIAVLASQADPANEVVSSLKADIERERALVMAALRMTTTA
jgi:hypothetical protein